ncbi:hypothetical protein SDJN02_13444 [Cucurbita argyrosperma subsp. argyrosperma]|nr:hypothetical protein SDJN02_13444 [Cucurbita argyrosperma subsp. argyrosperma]
MNISVPLLRHGSWDTWLLPLPSGTASIEIELIARTAMGIDREIEKFAADVYRTENAAYAFVEIGCGLECFSSQETVLC